MLAKKFNSLLK